MQRAFLNALLRVRALLHDRSGTTAIEFALVAPILFMLLFGVVEAGRLAFVQAALHTSLAEAARCAAINPAGCGTPRAAALEVERSMAALAAPVDVDPQMVVVRRQACGLMLSISLPYQPIIMAAADIGITLSAEACARQ